MKPKPKEWSRHIALSLSHDRSREPILSQHQPHLSLSLSGIVSQIKILSSTNDILPKWWNNEGWESRDLKQHAHELQGKLHILLCANAMAVTLLTGDAGACMFMTAAELSLVDWGLVHSV